MALKPKMEKRIKSMIQDCTKAEMLNTDFQSVSFEATIVRSKRTYLAKGIFYPTEWSLSGDHLPYDDFELEDAEHWKEIQ